MHAKKTKRVSSKQIPKLSKTISPTAPDTVRAFVIIRYKTFTFWDRESTESDISETANVYTTASSTCARQQNSDP